MDSLLRPTCVLKESQLMALRRAVMLQDLYGDKIGRGFMDEVEILGHSDQRMCVCVCVGDMKPKVVKGR